MNTDQKFDLILSELQKTNSRLEHVETVIVAIQAEQIIMKQDIAVMKQDITDMKQDIADIKAEQAVMKQDIKNLHIMIEQDLMNKINIIAEGHFLVLRKLEEMQAMYRYYEKLALNVELHNMEIRQIKE